jgi:hypothetical protein
MLIRGISSEEPIALNLTRWDADLKFALRCDAVGSDRIGNARPDARGVRLAARGCMDCPGMR